MASPPKSAEPSNPHDALFRSTFSNVEHAADEFRAVLPSELLAAVNLTTLRLASGSFVDTALASSQSDLLFSLEVRGKPALLYLLFEHQSSVDQLMPFRILKYVVRILDRHISTAGGAAEALPLPAVFPLVLHHSSAGWTAPTRLEQLFAPELVALPSLLELVPRLGFLLDDISQVTDDALRERALGALPTLTLWALRDARRPGRVQQALKRWGALIRALRDSDTGGEALTTIFRYLSLVVEDLDPQTLLAITASTPSEAKETLMTTLAERWKAEGKLEGRAEGSRGVLIHQLEFKFGDLSSADRARIDAASEEQLLRWTTRVLSADSTLAVLVD